MNFRDAVATVFIAGALGWLIVATVGVVSPTPRFKFNPHVETWRTFIVVSVALIVGTLLEALAVLGPQTLFIPGSLLVLVGLSVRAWSNPRVHAGGNLAATRPTPYQRFRGGGWWFTDR